MRRRNFLAALASLPAVGFLFKPAVATPTFSERLAAVRDLLLPALWQFQSNDLTLQIDIDHENEALIVKGRCLSKSRELGFAITKEAIVDRLYFTSFGPSCELLVRCLTSDDHNEKFYS